MTLDPRLESLVVCCRSVGARRVKVRGPFVELRLIGFQLADWHR
jgi:hypothetical protein